MPKAVPSSSTKKVDAAVNMWILMRESVSLGWAQLAAANAWPAIYSNVHDMPEFVANWSNARSPTAARQAERGGCGGADSPTCRSAS